MAGIIDIRYNYKKNEWSAKPRFASPEWGWAESAPVGKGKDPQGAVYALCAKLPEDMANSLQRVCPERMYRSPEYEWMSDRCVEVDGHCPVRDEWIERRRRYLLQKEISQNIAAA